MSDPSIVFLTVDDVLRLHSIAIDDQGGDPAILNRGLLEAAVAMPQQQFGGVFLHDGIAAMGAAYAFHICKNHPFADGNKRAGHAAMVGFFALNDWVLDATNDEVTEVILSLAAGGLDKQTFTQWALKHARSKPTMELRNYFRHITPQQFVEKVLSLLPAVTGAKPEELSQSFEEAVRSMPVLAELARQQREAKVAGDEATWVKATMTSVTIIALYRIAEDMGYEW